MEIEIHLHTILRRETPDGMINKMVIEVPDGCTVSAMNKELNIELDPDAILIVINGQLTEETQVLHTGDQVHLMPAISGGQRQ